MSFKQTIEYVLVCDICRKKLGAFHTRDECLNDATILGWKIWAYEKYDGSQGDLCPNCYRIWKEDE